MFDVTFVGSSKKTHFESCFWMFCFKILIRKFAEYTDLVEAIFLSQYNWLGHKRETDQNKR